VPKLVVVIVGDGNSGASDTFPLIEEASKQLFDAGNYNTIIIEIRMC
jgi:hypothetical protein